MPGGGRGAHAPNALGLRAVPVIQFIIMILELLRRFGMDVNFEDIVVTEDSRPVAAPAPLLCKAS